MKRITKKWIEIAEGDWDVAQRVARARKKVIHRAVCFHCQQCAEKYLKAKLYEAGIPFKKTHDLESLLMLILLIEPTWTAVQAEMKFLNDFSVDIRYPDVPATKRDSQRAVKDCRKVRKLIRQSLGLPA